MMFLKFCDAISNGSEVIVLTDRQTNIRTKSQTDTADNNTTNDGIGGVGWLGSVVVGRRTSDRKIASSTPGRCIAG